MPRDSRHAFRAAVGTSCKRDVQVCETGKAAAVDDPIVRLDFHCPTAVVHILILNLFASPTDLLLFILLPRLWCSQLLSSIPLTHFRERSSCLLYFTQGHDQGLRLELLSLLMLSNLHQRFLRLIRLLNLEGASYGLFPEQSQSHSVFLISSALHFFILHLHERFLTSI